MTPRELPNLTVGNCPTMGHEAALSRRTRSTRWLIGCSLGLLIAAGVSATLFTQASETVIKKPAVVQPMDRDQVEPPKANPRLNTAEQPAAPTHRKPSTSTFDVF